MDLSVDSKRELIEWDHARISVSRQCDLLDLSRSSLYYKPCGESAMNLHLMRRLDEQYTTRPYYGVLRMTAWLRSEGYPVNQKRVRRLLRLMDLMAIYPKPNLSVPDSEHKVYPYLLRDVKIVRSDQVWSTDITYIRMARGFVYLTAVIDWYSRYVLSWGVSNTLEGSFCVEAVERALRIGRPEIFNTDQGSQYTSPIFTGPLLDLGIAISMDGKKRALDNIFVERLWRTVKYELIYLNEFDSIPALNAGLRSYFEFYNHCRQHQSLGARVPADVYAERLPDV